MGRRIFATNFFLLSLMVFPILYGTASAQGLLKEALFTRGDTNIVLLVPPKPPDALHIVTYRLWYGTKLQHSIPKLPEKPQSVPPDSQVVVFGLHPDSLYYFKAYFYIVNKITDEVIDSSETSTVFSHQDAQSPAIEQQALDSLMFALGTRTFVPSNKLDTLQIRVADRQIFYYYRPNGDTTVFAGPFVAPDSGAGIYSIQLKMDGNDLFNWNLPQNQVAPLDTTFMIPDTLRINAGDGIYHYKLTVKDAAAEPDQGKPIVGNQMDTTFTFIYDTTPPTLDFSPLKLKYLARDTTSDGQIVLKAIVKDNLSGIDRNSLRSELRYNSSEQPEIVTTRWLDGDTVAFDVNFKEFEGWCRLILSVTDSCRHTAIDTSDSFFVDLLVPQIDHFNIFDPDIKSDALHHRPWPGFTNQTIVLADSFLFKKGDSRYKPDWLMITGDVSVESAFSDTLQLDLRSLFPDSVFGENEIASLPIRIAGKDISNNLQPESTIPGVFISYDNLSPVLDSIVVKDASTGARDYTDSEIVHVYPYVNEKDSGIVYFGVWDEGFKADTTWFRWTGAEYYEYTLPDTGKRTLWGIIRDHAANWSDVKSATIIYDSESPAATVELADSSTAECFAARKGFANDTTVFAIVKATKNSPDFLTITNLDGDRKVDIPIKDTTLIDLTALYPELRAGQHNSLYTFRYFARRSDGAQQDPVTIRLHFDNMNPELDSVILKDVDFRNDGRLRPFPGWANEDSVWLFMTPKPSSGDKDQMKLWIDVPTPLDFSGCQGFLDSMIVRFSPQQGKHVVYAAIRDSAGNWSRASTATINLDFEPPDSLEFTLSDLDIPKTGWTNDSLVQVDLRAKDPVTADLSGLNLLDPLIFLWEVSGEDSARKFTEKHDTEFIFSAPFKLSNWIDGKGTLHALVRDLAGNHSTWISTIRYDSTKLVDVTAYDRDDLDQEGHFLDAHYTDQATVVIVIGKRGTPSHYKLRIQNDDWSTTWIPYSSDTINAELTSPNESNTISVALMNNKTGLVTDTLSTTIVWDNIYPEFSFTLRDITQKDVLSNSERREFKASDPFKWSNSDLVWAIADPLRDNFALEYLKYNGEKYPPLDTTEVSLEWIQNESGRVEGLAADSAGNESPGIVDDIQYDAIPPELNVVPDAPDTFVVEPDSQNRIWIMAWFKEAHPWKFVISPDSNFTDKQEKTFKEVQVLREDTVRIPYEIGQGVSDQILYVLLADSAGNASKMETVHIKIELKPVIAVRLFDQSEYEWITGQSQYPHYELPDPTAVDHRYTNESTVVVYIKKLSGNWDRIKFGQKEFNGASDWKPVPDDKDAFIDLLTVDVNNSNDTTVTVWAIVGNRAGAVSDTVWAGILYDRIPPEFSMEKVLADGGNRAYDDEVTLRWTGSDNGAIQALFLYEKLESGEVKPVSTFPARDGSNSTVFQLDQTYTGWRTVYGFLADSASIGGDMSDWYEQALASGQISRIDSIRINFGKKEHFAYPNPFNPTQEHRVYFHVDEKVNGDIKIVIYDMFGNLIWYKTISGVNADWIDGKLSEQFSWDGRDSNGNIVSTGTYLVQFLSGEGTVIKKPIVVGVLR